MRGGRSLSLLLLSLASCAAAPRWQSELQPALVTAREQRRDLVVFFAFEGRDASDRMQSRLDDPVVMRALARGGFAAVVVDANARQRLYGEWVGGGEGMGIAVLDGDGRCYAARPGPQDPEELAAMLDLCAGHRDELARLRSAASSADADANDVHRLGCLYLLLGCRVMCEPLLLDAATAGVADARHRLARLYALDGNLAASRRWLRTAPATPQAQVTEGYVLFKERRHQDAVRVFEAALATGKLGAERQRALLYLGKALHEDQRDEQAVPVLEALSAEGTGSTFEAAARHTLGHIYDPQHGHAH